MSVVIGKNTYELLNKQVTEELASYYLYLGMASALAEAGLNGCAKWMKAQAAEEQVHAMKIFEHIEARGEPVRLFAIAAPKYEWKNPVNVFEAMLAHEQKVTSLIMKIYESAVKEKDYATMSFIQWFINEQVEEEDTARTLLEKIQKVKTSDSGMFLFDAELAERK